MKQQFINLDRISAVETYRYHIDKKIPKLHESIENEGIITPLFLCQDKELIIVDGFRRYFSAKNLRMTIIPVIIYASNSIEKVFIQSLHLDISMNNMSVIEKLLACALIPSSFSIETQTKIKKYLKLDFIPDVDKIIQYVLPLPYYIKKYIHNNNFSLRVLGKLSQFDYTKYQHWFKLASLLNYNSSEIFTLLEQVRDITQRENIKLSELAAHVESYKILDGNFTPGQKKYHLKKKMAEYRMPLQTKINTKLQIYSKNIQQDFKGNLIISWDKNLEDTGISLLFKISNKQTAGDIIKILNKEKIQSQILDMINITKYLPEEPK